MTLSAEKKASLILEGEHMFDVRGLRHGAPQDHDAQGVPGGRVRSQVVARREA